MITNEQYIQFAPYFALEDIEDKSERLEFIKLFSSLPQNIKNILISAEITEKIINIGKNFELDEFDIEALSYTIRKLATAEVFIGDGIEFIANKTGLTLEKAKNVLGLIINDIFNPTALEDIKKIQTLKFTNRIESAVESKPRQEDQSPIQASTTNTIPKINSNTIDLRNKQN